MFQELEIWFSIGSRGNLMGKRPKIHPSQKPVKTLKKLIKIFTDEGDVVIDPCAGSGTTLRAAAELGRSTYGFEIDRIFYRRAKDEMLAMKNEEFISPNEDKNQLSIFDFMEDKI